jgi:hypothetical protein
MLNSQDIGKAIKNLMKWTAREKWADRHHAVFEEHVGPFCARFDIPPEQIVAEIGEHIQGDLLGVAFEDFLTCEFEPDQDNVVVDYLKHAGWRESVVGRRYLDALRTSVMRLYEIADVSPGEFMVLRDVFAGGAPVRIEERLGSRSAVKWDKVATRVLPIGGKHYASGVLLLFPAEVADMLVRAFKQATADLTKHLRREARRDARPGTSDGNIVMEIVAREFAPQFTDVWLTYQIERARRPLPKLVNNDGEALLFSEVRFPFKSGDGPEIERRLDESRQWQRDGDSPPRWIWLLRNVTQRLGQHTNGEVTFKTLTSAGGTIQASIELRKDALMLSVNSAQRSERASQLVKDLFGSLVGNPLTVMQTPEQMLANAKPRRDAGGHQDSGSPLSPEDTEKVTRAFLDQHYRQCLDQPIPALENKTPRQCARSKPGRARLVAWLKYLENQSQRRLAGGEPYDFRWMWEELGIADLRN